LKRPAFPIARRGFERKVEPDGDVLEENREAIAAELLMVASACITDVVRWDEKGRLSIKASSQVSSATLRAIKTVRAKTRIIPREDGDPIEEHTIEFEMHDKLGALRTLAKGAGLMEPKRSGNRPSVFGIGAKLADPEPVPAEGEKVGAQ
jgi:hypothetical protein